MAIFRKKHPKTSTSASGKFGATLFGLIFMGMGLVFAGLILSQAMTTIKARTWKETPCTITESSVKRLEGIRVMESYRPKSIS